MFCHWYTMFVSGCVCPLFTQRTHSFCSLLYHWKYRLFMQHIFLNGASKSSEENVCINENNSYTGSSSRFGIDPVRRYRITQSRIGPSVHDNSISGNDMVLALVHSVRSRRCQENRGILHLVNEKKSLTSRGRPNILLKKNHKGSLVPFNDNKYFLRAFMKLGFKSYTMPSHALLSTILAFFV